MKEHPHVTQPLLPPTTGKPRHIYVLCQVVSMVRLLWVQFDGITITHLSKIILADWQLGFSFSYFLNLAKTCVLK